MESTIQHCVEQHIIRSTFYLIMCEGLRQLPSWVIMRLVTHLRGLRGHLYVLNRKR